MFHILLNNRTELDSQDLYLIDEYDVRFEVTEQYEVECSIDHSNVCTEGIATTEYTARQPVTNHRHI